MHRRPPAAPRPAEPHRVTIVTTCWGRDGDERYLVTRLVAGALLARAEVSILHLTPVPGPFPVLRDGAFEVRQVLANSPSPMRQALMLAAIDPSRDLTTLPDEAAREIFALEGGQTAEEIGGLLAATKPDAVVVAGLQQAWLASALRGLRPEPRVTVLPMTGRDARLRLAGYRDFLEVADSVGVLTTGERRSVIESAPDLASGSIFDLPLRFPVNREALSHRLVGLSDFSDYVLLLRGFPEGSAETHAALNHRAMRAELGGVAIAEVGRDEWRITDGQRSHKVGVAHSRVNLLRLMVNAVATVDLRPPSWFGREVIESLLLGTPVVARQDTVSGEHAVESGGGLDFGDHTGMMEAVRILLGTDRSTYSERGRAWAESRYGGGREVGEEVGNAILGPA